MGVCVKVLAFCVFCVSCQVRAVANPPDINITLCEKIPHDRISRPIQSKFLHALSQRIARRSIQCMHAIDEIMHGKLAWWYCMHAQCAQVDKGVARLKTNE
jgi:hypothetical protein